MATAVGSPMPSHAVDQIEAFGKVGMPADRRHQGLQLGPLALEQACDILHPKLFDAQIAAGLEPVLVACDILADLIDHGQLLGKR